jgi:hypothetical protein
MTDHEKQIGTLGNNYNFTNQTTKQTENYTTVTQKQTGRGN